MPVLPCRAQKEPLRYMCQQLGLGVEEGSVTVSDMTPLRQRIERAGRLITDQKAAGSSATPDSPLLRLLRSAYSHIRDQIESGLSCIARILPNIIEEKLLRRKLKRMQHLPQGVASVGDGCHFQGTSLEDELTQKTNWTLTLDWCPAVL